MLLLVVTTGIDPRVPLALLEGLRSTDTPEEMLEAEDVSRSLPRRLGLSGVISHQIRRYQELESRGRSLDVDEVENLVRLVERRPDSGAVFEAAGTWLATSHLRNRRFPSRVIARVAPAAVSRWVALRVLRQIATRVNPGASVKIDPASFSLQVEGSLLARASSSGEGCLFLVGALERVARSHLAGRAEPVHSRCEARGDPACEWRLAAGDEEEAGD